MIRRPSLTTAVAAVAALGVTAATLGAIATSATSAPAAAPAATAATLPTGPLDILLTNDDGWQAAGINAVYDALVADGHHVTMVAPATNQSGVSARVDFSGTLTAIEQEENIWSVSTSPAGTVLFALDAVLEERPDLIISGTNVGANTGFDTNFSGTIGAATVGTGMFDIPSIAVSTATAGYTADAPGAYEETADLVVDLLDRGLPTLPRGQFLNINYPILTDDLTAPKGVAYTANAQASAAAFTYTQQDDPTQFKIVGARGTEQPAAGTDTAMLKDGWVTIGVLDADRSVKADAAPAVADLVRELNGDPAPTAPKPVVTKVPKRVASKSNIWLPTTNIVDASSVKVVWKAKSKKAKTLKTTAVASGNLVKVSTPKKPGKYVVTIKLAKKKLRSSPVTAR